MKTLYTTLLEKMQEAKRLVPMLPGDMKLSLRDSVFMFHHLHGRPLTISCISVKTFYYKKSMASSNNSKLGEFNYGCDDGDNLERKYIFNNTCEGYNGALVVRFEDFVSEFSMYNYYSSHTLISLAIKERLSSQEMSKVCQDVMQKNFMGDNLSINKKQLIDLNLNDAMARLRSLQSLTKVPFLQLEEMANRGFYYEEYLDIVCCVMCNKRFSNWENARRLFKYHNIHSPLCGQQFGGGASIGCASFGGALFGGTSIAVASSEGSKAARNCEANAAVQGYTDNNSDFFSTVIFIKGHKLRGHRDVT
ncbi:uncharacterized protein LOC131940077 [Physella acuta]|uniref:uncharacterized protein LOC131940077 n=1 Tax=Physella acuta TaxID=109671 RepID=UPI0027DD1939|nr:uncharacterized protein LOC131940077 [Physella acuta]XP_059154625.1 uncharacterized protein LOC131940077 [Physella acuta]XP_059154626.1 uncharacterized protein LOC131940077 [Physella acuta]